MIGYLSFFCAILASAAAIGSILKRRRFSTIEIVVILISITQPLGVVFWETEFVNPGVIYFSQAAKVNLFLSYLIFIGVFAFFYFARKFQKPTRYELLAVPGSLYKISIGISIIGILVIFRYLIFSGQYENIGAAFNLVGVLDGSAVEYYRIRVGISEEVFSVSGQGMYLATIGQRLLLPPCTVYLFYGFMREKKYSYLFFSVAGYITLNLMSLLLANRAMVLFFGLYYPLCIFLILKTSHFEGYIFRRQFFKFVSFVFIASSLVGGLLFSITDNTTFASGLLALFGRVVFVPSFVAGSYYHLFPDEFPFRGLLGFLRMGTYVNDIMPKDIALMTTGSTANANSSFIATGFSAAGFYGVFVASAMVGVICLLIERISLKLPSVMRLYIYLYFAYLCFYLTNNAVFSLIITHFLLITAIFNYAMYRCSLYFNSGSQRTHLHATRT